MSFWSQSGRRNGRSSRRFFGRMLDAQYGTAEGVLGLIAVVLVVWLLWPEEQGPTIDQQAVWQQSVEEAERRRSILGAPRSTGREPKAEVAEREVGSGVEVRASLVERSEGSERPRIATPSELADRRGGGLQSERQAFQPGPERPSNLVARSEIETADLDRIEPTASPATEVPIPEAPVPEARLAGAIDTAPPVSQSPSASRSNEPALVDREALGSTGAEDDRVEVAALSSETLETEPLPEVDLSDLDTLVPSEVPDDETPPAETTEQAALTLPSDELSPAPDAAIEPFAVEPDPSVPTTDVKERPRDDAPTWLRNAVTSTTADDRPIIAVVIDDLGLNRSNTKALNSLPSPLTLAFLPYAGRIEAQTEAANAAGHELMLHLPMEPLGSDWPGPDALTTKIDPNEFTARLIKNLDRFEGFVGINNHMGSRLTADPSRMEVVMRELRKRDVLFLDSKTNSRSVAGEIAGENGVPNTTRDVFLDHVIDIEQIKRQLRLTEKVARRTGSAVAIGHPHGATIEALREWLPTLEARGFTLAPISAVVARRACSSGVLIAAETCGQYLQARSPAPPSALEAQGG